VDYTSLPGTVAFAAGQTSQSIVIDVIQDLSVLSNETVTLTLVGASPPTWVVVGTGGNFTATMVIEPVIQATVVASVPIADDYGLSL
jgi:hypothetical protein